MMTEAAGSSESWDTSPLFWKKELSAILSYIHCPLFTKQGRYIYIFIYLNGLSDNRHTRVVVSYVKIRSLKNRTLINGVNEILPVFSTFSPDVDKIRYRAGCAHKAVSDCELFENRRIEKPTLRRSIEEFLPLLSIFIFRSGSNSV